MPKFCAVSQRGGQKTGIKTEMLQCSIGTDICLCQCLAMLDTQAAATVQKMQRARGRAEVALKMRDGTTHLANLHQSGSAKAFLPKIHTEIPEVVFLNTSGGLTGGDEMRFALTLAEGTRATGTTQTAERGYASSGGVARVEVDLKVGDRAHLDWLPQETILFEGAGLHRKTKIALTGESSVLLVETIVLGRAAMAETLSDIDLHDVRQVTRDGQSVLLEPLRLSGQTLSSSGVASHGGLRAFATIALIKRGAEDAVEPVRRLLPDTLASGASGWDGKCVVRLAAKDAWPLRRALVPLLTHLRGAPMPRVWQI